MTKGKKCLNYMRDIKNTKIITVSPVKYDSMEISSQYLNYILYPILIISEVLIKSH